jgi:hypothetical protein
VKPGARFPVICLLSCLIVACVSPGPLDRAELPDHRLTPELARLPLAFEPNLGQAPAATRIVGRGPGLRIDLEAGGARLTPTRAPGARDIHLRWIGASSPAPPDVEHALPGKVLYYARHGPALSRRDVPTYRTAVYRDVYPGIDLVFHGARGMLEFDFVVAPGADPRRIALEVVSDSLALAGGDVVITGGDETFTLHAPVLYQESAAGRTPVNGRFRIDGRRLAFDVGAYDRTRPLVIDPVVTYSTFLTRGGLGVGLDAAGNMYSSGNGGIVKLAAGGTTALYTVVLGDHVPQELVVDAAGNAYVVTTCPYPRSGATFSCPTLRSLAEGRPTAQGDSGVYAAKLGPGGDLLFLSGIGGAGSPQHAGLAVDPAGNIYLAGFSPHGEFPLTRPPFARPGAPPALPAFVLAIAADLSRFVYFVEITSGNFVPTALAVDRSGAVYLTGVADDDFPVTPGAFQSTTGADIGAGVVAKIAPDASRIVYATYLGNRTTRPQAIAVDAGGNAFVAGAAGTGLPPANALQPAPAGGTDAFVTRLHPAGSSLVFSTYLGGGGADEARAIGLDGSGNVYVAGVTRSVDFPLRSPLPAPFGATASNFITALTPSGLAFIYSTYFGDAATAINALAVSANGTALVTGGTSSASYPTVRPFRAAPGPVFLARIDPAQPRVFVTSPAANATVAGTLVSDVWMENTAAGSRTVRLSIGGVTLATATSIANHVTLPWDSRRVGNGTQTLVATVTDASGASGSGSRPVNVQNAGGGGSALAAAFTSPAGGATVRGAVAVGMTQSGAASTPITFTLAVDGAQVFTAAGTAGSAAFSWNSATVGNGAHTLRLTVRDGAGRTATAARTVTVANGTAGPSLGVAVTAPRPGATVRGTVWFTIWVNGAAGGAKSYTLTEGGRTLGSATTTSAGPVSIPWVTGAANNGARIVTVTVREGTRSAAGSVGVTVAN